MEQGKAVKRYYWLKLKEEFFVDKEVKKLRKIAGGDTYTIIYLKLMLLSLKTDGRLYFDSIEDTFAEELALEIDEDSENVRVTLMYLEKMNLLRLVNEDELYLTQMDNLIGSESESAQRVRKHREKIKKIEIDNEKVKAGKPCINTEDKVQVIEDKTLHSNADVTRSNADETTCNSDETTCNTYTDIYTYKDKYIYTEKETDNPPLIPQGEDEISDCRDYNKYSNLENVKYVLNEHLFERWETIRNNPRLWQVIKDWMEYKDATKPKKSNHYATLRSLKILLNRFVDYSLDYGVEEVERIVNDSIIGTYQGIIWNKLKKPKVSSFGADNLIV